MSIRARRFRGSIETLEGRELLSTTANVVAALGAALIDTPPPTPTYPVIDQSHTVITRGKVTGLVIEFSHPMNPVSATNLQNYEVDAYPRNTYAFLPSATTHVSISTIAYNPNTDSVTIALAAPLPLAKVGTFGVSTPYPDGGTIRDAQGVALSSSTMGSTPDGQLSTYIAARGISYGPIEMQQQEQVLTTAIMRKLGASDFSDRVDSFLEGASILLAGITHPLWGPLVHPSVVIPRLPHLPSVAKR